MSEDWNKATMVFESSPDKWMGLESFQRDVMLLRQIAAHLNMGEGRRTAMLTISTVSAEGEDDTPWLTTDAKIDRHEEERGL